jgi:hypothetical protein
MRQERAYNFYNLTNIFPAGHAQLRLSYRLTEQMALYAASKPLP